MHSHELPGSERPNDGSKTDIDVPEVLSSLVELGLVRELGDGMYELTKAGRMMGRGMKMYERYRDHEPSVPPEQDQWLEALRLLDELPHEPDCDCEQSSMSLSGWTDDGLYLLVRNSVRLVTLLERDGDALRLVV